MPIPSTPTGRPMLDKGIVVRMVLYGVGIVYLVLDMIFGGPLRKAVFRQQPSSPEVIEAAKREGVAARVYFQPILLTQVDRRVEEQLWKQGRTMDGLEPAEFKLLRLAAVNELVDLHLLRLKAGYNELDYPVPAAEVEAEVARFVKRYPSEKEYRASLARNGWSEKELRMRLEARLQQQKYLEGMIEVSVSEEEARAWFDQNRENLGQPERIRVRHVFLSTLNRKPAEARRILAEDQARLKAGSVTFEELARERSEDPRTSGRGGDLGWVHEKRIAPDFGTQVFKLAPGAVHLVQTGIGWHLVEVIERRPPRERTYEEARADVVAALEAVKRDQGLRLYRNQLREREKHKVEIFFDMLEVKE